MKINKILSIFLLSSATLASAQISFAAKANALIPTSSASWKNLKSTVTTAVDQKGKNIVGFNTGLSVKINLPAIYVMPEIYYSNFNNEVTVANDVSGAETTVQAKTSRVDVPVLVGYNLVGDLLSGFLGPVASFNLAKNEDYGSFAQKVNARDFTVGYQLGLQSEISKVIITAKYEGAFSKDQRKFINTVAGSSQEINYDNRPSLFMLGLGYKF